MNWRLTSELIAYVPTDSVKKEVFLAATEKKQYQTQVLKLINERPYQEVRLYENQFELKFDGDDNTIDLYLKCNELSNSEEWFKVENFYKPGIWNLLENHTIEKGIIKTEEENKFEVIFEEELPYVSFIEPNMKNFKKCFEEMKRKINCEMCKKTSKWIPGHRYDSFSESIFPLCTALSRKTSITNSEYIKDFEKMPEVFIYVNELDKETTVSEVLKNRSFGDGPADLKIAFKPKLMVDVGEVLKNDYSGNIKDYWLSIYDNARSKKKSIKEILDTFSVTSDKLDNPDLPISELTDITQEVIENVLIDCWNLTNVRGDLVVGDSNSIEDNTTRTEKLFVINGILDVNFLKGLYYPELYNDLEIDLSKSATAAIGNISSLKMTHDFNIYLKYIKYWSNPLRVNTEKCYSKQRVKSTKYKLDVVTLKDIFGESELKDTIVEVINHVRENFGLGATEYSVINVGTKKEPREYITCKITLEDIIKYKKGVLNMSETLKNDILEHHFAWVQVMFDKDGTLT